MNVLPLQSSNNQQSFGSFNLTESGAKKLATICEETPKLKKSIYSIINPMRKLKAKVLYDGETCKVTNAKGDKCLTVLDEAHVITKIDNPKAQIWSYKTNQGLYNVEYNHFIPVTPHPIERVLFNAGEIAKDMDSKDAIETYNAYLATEKQKRIDIEAKRLLELFG